MSTELYGYGAFIHVEDRKGLVHAIPFSDGRTRDDYVRRREMVFALCTERLRDCLVFRMDWQVPDAKEITCLGCLAHERCP